MHTSSTDNKKKWIVLASAAIVVLVALFLVWFFFIRADNPSSSKSPRPVNSVDYSGPTEEEKAAGNAQKQINVDKAKTDANPPTVTTAAVEISDAAQYGETIEVRGFVSNVYEDGTCTATFTRSGYMTVTTTSTAFKDASNTQCGANDTARSKFAASGTWKLTLTYTSASGISGSVSKDVQVE